MENELEKWSEKITAKFGIRPARKLTFRQIKNSVLYGQTRKPRSAKEFRRVMETEEKRQKLARFRAWGLKEKKKS